MVAGTPTDGPPCCIVSTVPKAKEFRMAGVFASCPDLLLVSALVAMSSVVRTASDPVMEASLSKTISCHVSLLPAVVASECLLSSCPHLVCHFGR